MSSEPKTFNQTIAVAVTGASGIVYAFRLIEELIKADCRVYLMFSKAAQMVVGMETDWVVPARPKEMEAYFSDKFGASDGQIRAFADKDWMAPVASGSAAPDAMVVCPCTTGTLSAIAMGASESLMDRAADVVLKERKKLILVPREAPFSEIHLENMLKLARMGVVILPPNPGFYHRPQTIDDLVDFVVARILDQLNIPQNLLARWGEE